MTEMPQHLHPLKGNHQIQYYENDDNLVHAITISIEEALRSNQGFLIIASKENNAEFQRLLTERGWDVDRFFKLGQLILLDVKIILERLMIHHVLDTEMLHSLLWGEVNLMQKKFPKVKAYGEMVKTFWKDNNLHGMITVDRIWKKLSDDLNFSLLTAYSMQHLDDEKYGIAFHDVIQK